MENRKDRDLMGPKKKARLVTSEGRISKALQESHYRSKSLFEALNRYLGEDTHTVVAIEVGHCSLFIVGSTPGQRAPECATVPTS